MALTEQLLSLIYIINRELVASELHQLLKQCFSACCRVKVRFTNAHVLGKKRSLVVTDSCRVANERGGETRRKVIQSLGYASASLKRSRIHHYLFVIDQLLE